MPTKRTIDQLYALFAPGQAAGSIGPDRVQDLILSLRPGFGRISLATPVETTITTQGEWVKLAGVTALGDGAFTFSMPENGRLQCNCPVPSRIVIDGAVSLQNGSQTNFEVAIAKNGSVLPETVVMVRFGPGGGAVEAVLFGDFTQAQGDYVEVWARNTSSAANVTALALYLRAMTYVI
jgi:hypothetical protein